jgi:nucleoside-diphosphate-sugar epimerase
MSALTVGSGSSSAGGRRGADERFLVTGALGCIGAWTIRILLHDQAQVVGFDVAAEPRRLRQLLSADELAAVPMIVGDIAELNSVERAMDEHGITHVIHLAALQVPFCRADPPQGARVNVLGTVNVFEASRRRRDLIRGLVYTSSIGMFDAGDVDPATGRLGVDANAHPTTHYGVYKQANEGNARAYWLDHGLSTIGIRPMTVFGPGRDQGLTSDPTKAILAAVLGRRYRIGFGGRTLFQYAADVAQTVVQAARSGLGGARVFNLAGSLASMRELVEAIEGAVSTASGLISFEEEPLPFPEAIATTGLEQLGPIRLTPLNDAVRETAEMFKELVGSGRLQPAEYGLA